tara:strand:+ start:53 stop:937 length:885 start_codon:yes stop_codon:yes gene_type:complete
MNSPYKLPTPSLISFSGGRTSAYMLYHILKEYDFNLPNDVYVTFANTGKEMPETLDFIQECATEWNIPVHWLEFEIGKERPIWRTREVTYETASRDGRPFADLIKHTCIVPNPSTRICTRELKINVMKRFMQSKGHKEWHNIVGLRHDEPRRVSNMRKANDKGTNAWETMMPLNDAMVSNEMVLDFWKNNSFDLRLPTYDGKTIAGNCDLCFLKNKAQLITMIKERPELAEWWSEQEIKTLAERRRRHGQDTDKIVTTKFNKNYSYIDLVDLSEKTPDQLDLFSESTMSCFCTD